MSVARGPILQGAPAPTGRAALLRANRPASPCVGPCPLGACARWGRCPLGPVRHEPRSAELPVGCVCPRPRLVGPVRHKPRTRVRQASRHRGRLNECYGARYLGRGRSPSHRACDWYHPSFGKIVQKTGRWCGRGGSSRTERAWSRGSRRVRRRPSGRTGVSWPSGCRGRGRGAAGVSWPSGCRGRGRGAARGGGRGVCAGCRGPWPSGRTRTPCRSGSP
jgi:hypothetical protein